MSTKCPAHVKGGLDAIRMERAARYIREGDFCVAKATEWWKFNPDMAEDWEKFGEAIQAADDREIGRMLRRALCIWHALEYYPHHDDDR